ncbi:adenosylcobinamide-phosphate synthase [Rhodococcus triatomae]|uniref:Cobalamin biosynthesis protein CobD n=1 Tax=Rhodococcus triatomae TaxID=300028 RepID=A0A1G8DBS8_9NOCA|nr:adenosylcobinamide-phosphate synthase [Rhodococcus triatomae]
MGVTLTPRPGRARALGLLLGFAADRAFGDPRRRHPVAGFGALALRTECALYRDSRAAGIAYTTILVAGTACAGVAADRAVRRVGPGAVVATTALATWTVLGGTSLARTGAGMAQRLGQPGLDDARALLPSLCGRDPSALDRDGLARAALESVAENTSDAAVAPLLWGGAFGIPGLLAYRAANTLDAMVGYRSERYRNFGWASARLDDALNLVPARVAGALTVAAAPVVGGSPRRAWQAWRSDAAAHPSPNAGVAEASAAGALGIALGGRTEYPHGVEMRPVLGRGPAPTVADLPRAVRLSHAVQAGAVVVSAALAVAVGQFRVGRRQRRLRRLGAATEPAAR